MRNVILRYYVADVWRRSTKNVSVTSAPYEPTACLIISIAGLDSGEEARVVARDRGVTAATPGGTFGTQGTTGRELQCGPKSSALSPKPSVYTPNYRLLAITAK